MAHGRPRRDVPERDRARRRRSPSGSALHHRGTSRARRHRADARARGPHRRGDRPLAATEGANLRHAIHGRHGAVEAGRVRWQDQAADHRGAARRTLPGRSIRYRDGDAGPLYSGAVRHRHPHPAGPRVPHRRLEARQQPLVGHPPDEARLAALGEEGVLALVCDSTNAFRDGRSPTETEVARSIADIIKGAKRRVAVTTFASNVARVKAVADAALRAGASWWSRAGRCTGSSTSPRKPATCRTFPLSRPGFLFVSRADKVLVLCTGSQGEPRAAVARIAEEEHPSIALGARRSRHFLVAAPSQATSGTSERPERLARNGCDLHDRYRSTGARHGPSAARGAEADVCWMSPRWRCRCTERLATWRSSARLARAQGAERASRAQWRDPAAGTEPGHHRRRLRSAASIVMAG